MSQTVLVTGGAGFIGSHLVKRLSSDGIRVRVLDLKDPKTAIDGVEYQKGDVCDLPILKTCLEGADAVYHFAARVSVPYCQENLVDGYQQNLMGTLSVLEALKSHRKKSKLIFASSSAVYGMLGEEGKPISELTRLEEPLSYYAAQKLASEHAIRLFSAQNSVPAICFRFFNVFGPGQDPSSPYSGVIALFSKAAKEGRPLQLNGGGVNTRDFVSVHDITNACHLVLSLDDSKLLGQAMNLGTGKVTRISELGKQIMVLSKRNLTVLNQPPREGDVTHSLANIDKAKKLLNWEPAVSLKEGLQELMG